jgi:hypothetical protein
MSTTGVPQSLPRRAELTDEAALPARRRSLVCRFLSRSQELLVDSHDDEIRLSPSINKGTKFGFEAFGERLSSNAFRKPRPKRLGGPLFLHENFC